MNTPLGFITSPTAPPAIERSIGDRVTELRDVLLAAADARAATNVLAGALAAAGNADVARLAAASALRRSSPGPIADALRDALERRHADLKRRHDVPAAVLAVLTPDHATQPREIAERLDMTAPQVTRALNRLRDEGLAEPTERPSGATDRRARWWRATSHDSNAAQILDELKVALTGLAKRGHGKVSVTYDHGKFRLGA